MKTLKKIFSDQLVSQLEAQQNMQMEEEKELSSDEEEEVKEKPPKKRKVIKEGKIVEQAVKDEPDAQLELDDIK